MTKKEASFILANIDRRVCDDELSEALDIAIKTLEQNSKYRKEARRWKRKALEQEPCEDATLKDIFCMGCEYKEQEPCEDCVSRIEALNSLDKVENKDDWYRLTDVMKMIRNLPPVTPQPKTGHWIPVSERLPDNTDPVNITWVNHDPDSYYADIKDKPFTATGHYCNGRWWWYSATCQDYLNEYGRCDVDDMDDVIEVIAWMPLPEPYREVEE